MYTDSGDAQPTAWTLITTDGPHLYVDEQTRAGGLILMIDVNPTDPVAPYAAAALTAAEVATLIAQLQARTPAREEVIPNA